MFLQRHRGDSWDAQQAIWDDAFGDVEVEMRYSVEMADDHLHSGNLT